MFFFTCLVVLRIFDITTAIKSKSVNLALETVLEFNNRDNHGDIQFINNVQNFLDKIKTIINKNQDGRRSYRPTDQIFTEFLKNAIIILKNYEDEDLEDVFAVIDNEIRKYHYKGCKFYELIQNNDVRRYMAVKLNDVRSKSAEEIRYTLKQVFRTLVEENYDGRVKEFLDYINSLYRSDAKYKLRSFLSNLENYKSKSKRANLDLIKIVREGVRSILFDHYTDLNLNARRELKLKIETFWKELSSPQYIRHKVWNVKYTKSNGELFGKFDVIQTQQNLLYPSSMGPANNNIMKSTTTTPHRRWTVPTKSPFNNTTSKKPPLNRTRSIWRTTKSPNTTRTTTTKTSTTTKTKKKTKRPRRPGRPGRPKFIKYHDSNYDSDENKAFVTRQKHDRTHRPHRYRTRGRERLHTLWEEEIEGKPVKTIISNHEAQINVEGNEFSEYHKHKHDRNRHKHKKSHKKDRHHERFYRRYSSPKFRLLKPSPAVASYRKYVPRRVISDEGMTIESFETAKIPRRKISFRKQNDNDTFGLTTVVTIDNNFMRRINDLEREVSDMKSKIINNETLTTTTINVIEDNYALDFWEGTPSYEYTTSKSTTNKAPTSVSGTSVTTTANVKRSENITEVDLFTVPSMATSKNIFIPVNIKHFQNVTRGGTVLNKAPLSDNKTVPFSENNDNGTIELDIENDLSAMEYNFTTSTFMQMDTKTLDIPTLVKNVTDSKSLVNEIIRKNLVGVFKNITTPSYLVLPPIFNASEHSDLDDPFEDIDNMGFIM